MYHECEKKYVGWERKRGAIETFIRFLSRGELSKDSELFGCNDNLYGTQYLITLDSDTQLGINQAKELIGIASHPLNIPKIQKQNGQFRV